MILRYEMAKINRFFSLKSQYDLLTYPNVRQKNIKTKVEKNCQKMPIIDQMKRVDELITMQKKLQFFSIYRFTRERIFFLFLSLYNLCCNTTTSCPPLIGILFGSLCNLNHLYIFFDQPVFYLPYLPQCWWSTPVYSSQQLGVLAHTYPHL